MDQDILEYITAQRNEQITITEKKARRKAKLLFIELYPDTGHEFKASKGWFTRMFRRNNLVHRRVTSVVQKILNNTVEIVEKFLHDMKNIVEFANLANMDEIPRYFDIPRSSIIDKKKNTDGQNQDQRCRAFSFHRSFNSRSKEKENEFFAFCLPTLLIFKNLANDRSFNSSSKENRKWVF